MRDWQVERGSLGDFNRHFWQLRAVAKLAGADLGDAMREGRISTGDYAAMVTRCRSANCLQACVQWLANPAATKGDIPEFCLNRPALEQLRARG
ncbi:DUF6455 family protein [Pseudophaeobacter sp.]|uniref:DUF6455 family protein n=1 Tax=Pseudophaeobacter sp. TaxID=1971739 RepID=UPI003296AA78